MSRPLVVAGRLKNGQCVVKVGGATVLHCEDQDSAVTAAALVEQMLGATLMTCIEQGYATTPEGVTVSRGAK